MFSSLRRLIALLALAAVACLPAQGLHRGWICECSGIARAACCSLCHDEAECSAAGHHEHGDGGSDHQHPDSDDHHDEDVASLDAATASITVGLLPPVWVCLWLPWLPACGGETSHEARAPLPRPPPPGRGGTGGEPHSIHRSVSLRI